VPGRFSRRLACVVGGALLISALLPVAALADSPPAITSTSGTLFAVGAPNSFTVTATGGSATTLTESGALPSGVAFVNLGTGHATISGTPALGTIGTYPIVITATNGTPPNAVQAFTLVVAAGAASRLSFSTQPGGGTAGVAWSQQPRVAVLNSSGAVVTSDSSTVVTLSISANPSGGALSCTSGTSVTVVAGYANFSGCSISLGSPSAYFTLTASTSSGWTAATSSAFYVGGASSATSRLSFSTQPGGGTAAVAWSQQPVVAVLNSSSAVVTTDYSTVVTLYIGTNPTGGALSCTGGTSVTVVAGYAYFSGCSISPGSPSSYFTLYASTSSGWTAATSSAFYVAPAVLSPYAITLQPRSATGSRTLARGTQVTYTATERPIVGGQTITFVIYTWDGSEWVRATSATFVADSSGRASLSWRWGKAGWWYIRARANGTAAYSTAWSNYERVVVR
jgi:trimeric autotransporter adhesin